MLDKQDLQFLSEVLRNHRFMMAAACVAADLTNNHKQALNYMSKLHKMNDKLDKEVANAEV